jgi:hypothetical protein
VPDDNFVSNEKLRHPAVDVNDLGVTDGTVQK